MIANVFDSNTITQCYNAIDYGTSTNNSPFNTGAILTDNGGMLDNILWNTFASSDGESGTDPVFNDDTYGPDTDTAPFLSQVNDVWQYQSAPADAGIVWTILSDDFFSSDGTITATQITKVSGNDTNRDSNPDDQIDDIWQDYGH
jgi:hypothetical protein